MLAFVEDYRQPEHLFGAEQDRRPAEPRAAIGDVGAEHLVGQCRQSNLLPHLADEQLMRLRERLEPTRKSVLKGDEVGRYARRLLGNGGNHRQHVLDPVVALQEQSLLALGKVGEIGALGNVADETDEQPPAELFAAGNRQFDRKLASVAVKRANLDVAIKHRAFAGGEKMAETVLMRVAVNMRDDQVAGLTTLGLRPGPAKNLVCDPVPADDLAARPHHHDGIRRGVEDRLQTGVKAPPGKTHDAYII